MDVLIVCGTGGSGATTVAAATARAAAGSGRRTLLLALDDGMCLGEALAVDVGEEIVELAAGLHVAAVDPHTSVERVRDGTASALAAVTTALGLDGLRPADLAGLPGARDAAVLVALRRAVAAADHDLMVLDVPGPETALRLLALPGVVRTVVDTLLPVERRVMRALATGSAAAATSPAPRAAGTAGDADAADPPRDLLVDALDALVGALDAAAGLLGGRLSVRLVTVPARAAREETRRTAARFALYGVPVETLVVNRVVPAAPVEVAPAAGGRDSWWAARARVQRELLAEHPSPGPAVPVVTLSERATEPVGPSALDALAAEGRLAPVAVGAVPGAERGPGVERGDDEYVLVLPLAGARREELALSRVQDELALTVCGRVRHLMLPSALRRCDVVGAALRDGELRVRFRPDPALWRQR